MTENSVFSNAYVIDYLKKQKLFELSLFINNRCNLKCKHCYVGTKDEEPDVDLDRWKTIIGEAIDSGVRIIGIVGKEPLLTAEKTFEIVEFVKQKDRGTIVGFVTNGILLPEHAEAINKLDIDYIDISIDGIREAHDYIRGNGSFQKTVFGIKRLIDVGFPKKSIFLSITLTNRIDMKKIIECFAKFGIVNYVVSPYMQFSHNCKDIATNEIEFFDSFMNDLNNVRTTNEVKVIIKTDYSNLRLVKHFIERKYIDLDRLYQDPERNIIFTEHRTDNVTAFFNFLPFNTELIREIRITSDGFVLSCIDQGFSDYKKRSVGNIKNLGLNEILKGKLCQKTVEEKIIENVTQIKSCFSRSNPACSRV